MEITIEIPLNKHSLKRWKLLIFFFFVLMALVGSPFIALADFVRGDVDGDGMVTSTDLSDLQSYINSGLTTQIGCPDKADINDDGQINSADSMHLNAFLNSGGAPPAAPYPNPGNDTSPDAYHCGQCFVAGNSGSQGWIYKLSPPFYNSPSLVVQSTDLQGLRGITSYDYSSLGVVSKPSSVSGTRISLVAVGPSGGFALPVVTGPLIGLLNGDPQEVAQLGQTGIFALAEGSSNGIVNQVTAIGAIAPTPLLTPNLRPQAVRFDRNGDVIIGSGSNFDTKILKVSAAGGSLQSSLICSVPFGGPGPDDLVIDRVDNRYVYVLNRNWPNDQLRSCNPGGLLAEQISLPNGIGSNASMKSVEQFPADAMGQNFLLGHQGDFAAQFYSVPRTGGTSVLLFSSFLMDGIEDMYCFDDR